MEILRTPAEMHEWRLRTAGATGLVPTMGYLHAGHLSLVERSVAENDATVASIFVNPTQFGPNEDFASYPRDEERDLAMLREAGVVAVYAPGPEAVYPEGYQTYVSVEQVTLPLEGAARPGHFRGVATVVLKLFNAVQPQRAYFGRKDAQQLRVIRRMVRDLDLAVEVVGCPIIREPDGLAMSSRNVYLSPAERSAAVVLSKGLFAAKAAFKDGVRDANTLRAMVLEAVAAEPLAELEYVSLADDVSLEEIPGTVASAALLSAVMRMGRTRLLDNVELA